MKKIFTLLILIPIMAINGYAQSATAGIGDYEEEPGSVEIPIEVTGFSDLGAIQMYFEYDPAVLSYTGSSNPALSGILVNAFNLGGIQQVGISWSGSGYQGIHVAGNGNGNLVTINFEYITGTSDLNFLVNTCEVVKYEGTPIPVLYMDGSISPKKIASVSLPELTKTPNTGINIPLNVDFSEITDGVSSFNFVIDFDPGVITYQGIAHEVLSPVIVEQVSGSRISVSWLNPGATGSVLNGKLLDIVFDFTIGQSDLLFVEDLCAIGDNNSLDVTGNFTNGSISQDPATIAQISIDETTTTANTNVDVPLFVDFSGIPDGVSSFTFVLDFNETVVQYTGFSNSEFSSIDVDIVSSSRIAFSWFNQGTSGSIYNGKAFDVAFSFSGGYSDLSFVTELCKVGDNNVLDVNAAYTNGWIRQDPASIVKVIAGTLEEATAGTTVEVPITVQNFSNIGSFEFHINFDETVLTFLDIVNVNAGIQVSDLDFNVISNNILGLNWQSTTALNLNNDDKLFDLQFSFSQGESNLTFATEQCEVSDFQVNTLYTEFTDGLVSEFAPLDIAVKAAEVLAQPGDVLMPISAASFDNIGAFDLVISFDATKLTFDDLVNDLAALNTQGDLMYNLSGNQIFIGWNIDASAISGLTVSDDGKLFDLKFNYLGGESDVAFVQESCSVSGFDLVLLDVTYMPGVVKGGIQVQLNLYLEGLYNTATHEMNKAYDYDNGQSQAIPMYEGQVADLIDVELHTAGSYGIPVYTIEGVELLQDGTASFDIPAEYSGDYYITIKHRNHLETVSAAPVSFETLEVSYDFTTAANKAYGSVDPNDPPPQVELGDVGSGVWGIYGGDVSQDGLLTIDDSGPVNAGISGDSKGYIAIDVNGDAILTIDDSGIVNAHITRGIAQQIPD